MTKIEQKTRKHEHEIEIEASPSEVWKAIAEAEELIRWFPQQARVEPGKGGEIQYAWGSIKGTGTILEWEPPHHLKTSWMQALSPETDANPVVVDWFLEGRGGKTRLRLVHSGFGTGQEWDDEFEGTNRGWNFELYSLKHYLENHLGKLRRTLWPRENVLAGRENWNALLAGLFPGQELVDLHPGQLLRMRLSSGDPVEGRVVQWDPPHELSMTVKNWNQGLLRIGIEDCGAGLQSQVWVSLWDYPESEAAALNDRLQSALKAATPSLKSHSIYHSFPIQAEPADIYRAVSEPKGLDCWWSLKSSGTPELNHEYELDFGPGYVWRARVTRAVPNREFEFRMTDADSDWKGSRVGFRLTPGENSTQVDFRHEGWPEANSHYRISSFCWAMYLRLLKRYLEHGETVPYPKRLDA